MSALRILILKRKNSDYALLHSVGAAANNKAIAFLIGTIFIFSLFFLGAAAAVVIKYNANS